MAEPTLIAGAPNISGNIGSCTTQVAEVVSGRPTWYKQEIQTIATNSCTGQVSTYNSWKYTDAGAAVGLIGGVGIVIILGIILSTIVAITDRW